MKRKYEKPAMRVYRLREPVRLLQMREHTGSGTMCNIALASKI